MISWLPIREESLATFGGPFGLRDEGLLHSALARPQNIYAYNADSTFADLAAAYGFKLTAAQLEAIQIMLGVAAGEVDEHGLAGSVCRNTVPT